MNLMRWFWKNNQKLMAGVVIVLMFVFIGGAGLSYLAKVDSASRGEVLAYYGEQSKITVKDLESAARELEVLRQLRADLVFRPQDPRAGGPQDLRVLAMGELLFSEQTGAVETSARLKQIVRRAQLPVNDKQVNDLYRRAYQAEIYWLLLKEEARRAGLGVSAEEAANQLSALIPRLYPNATYGQLVSTIVAREGLSEEQILRVFADVLTVLEFGRMASSVENVTLRQAEHFASWQQETMDMNYVKIDASLFADSVPQPSESQIIEHFERHKQFLPGAVTDENPYGIGYKLPARVQLEYIALKLDDVAKTVTPPAQQDAEEFYQRNRARYTEQVRTDPNDPDSATPRTKGFAEVAASIMRELMQNRVDSRADQIISEARTAAEANLVPEVATAEAPPERLKESAADYGDIARRLSAAYGLPIYTGKTGFLSPLDIRTSERLGTLYVRSSGAYTGRALVPLAFAVPEVNISELGPYDPPRPRLYESIGPLRDVRESISGYAGKNIMLARVIDFRQASEPEGLDMVSRDVRVPLDPNETAKPEDVNTVRQSVIRDLRRMAAMDIARTRANEFVDAAQKDGWEQTAERFNELYGRKDANDANQPTARDVIRFETESGLRRMSPVELATTEMREKGDPASYADIAAARIESTFLDKLFNLVPPDANTLATAPTVLESKPMLAYYCIQQLTVNRLYDEEFERNRAMIMYSQDFTDSQALALAHYNPENILKRMNFRVAERKARAGSETPAADSNSQGGQ